MSSKLRHLVKCIWISSILFCIATFLYNPNIFEKENIANFIGKFSTYAWIIYFLLHLFRGFVLLPSTPLIFAGVIVFPSQLVSVLLVSVLGIILCSLSIYYFSDKLGLSKIFKKKNKLNLIEQKLNGKNSFYYILLWSFIPIVPTDLICYVSGALKIKILTFISSLFLGELVLCFIYIFGSSYFLNI